MPANEGNASDAMWPMPAFRFEADLGEEFTNVIFQEVSGLEAENPATEYHNSNDFPVSRDKEPDALRYGNVTLRHGIFADGNTFWDLYREIKIDGTKKRTVVIRLLDEGGNTAMQWILSNAWLTKITGTDPKTDGSETAVDTLEIAYERLSISGNE